MTMLSRTRLVLLLSTLTIAAHAGGDGPVDAYPLTAADPTAQLEQSNPASVAELGSRLAPMESLAARFNQTVTSADGYILQEVTGTLAVARPGKVRWHSDAPYEQLVVSDATTLWLYDPDLEQVTVRPFSSDISRTPAVLFIGEVQDLERDYRVSVERSGNRVQYLLEPRGDDALYERIAIEFDGELPAAMALWDSLGQTTRIGFSEVRVNAELDPQGFTFTPPAGVDVLVDE
ncbi:MAG: outer membrane lipoprotein chaperone LolA [Porticoccaceae bacterium]